APDNGPSGPSLQAGNARRGRAARIITHAGMSTTSLLALAPAWASVAAVLGALLIGLLVGTAFRARRLRRVALAMRESARERESLRRIAAELARIPDAEGVARALLDEIGTFFGVDFAALTFVSEDGTEGAGFL